MWRTTATTWPPITTTAAIPQSTDADRASQHSGRGEGAVMFQQRVANRFRAVSYTHLDVYKRQKQKNDKKL